ncbi:MAG: Uma2 family endonuclease [Pseudanabaenaceae cyanobacterium]
MTPTLVWTRADLALLPEDGNRYEVIAGELFVTRAPHSKHRKVCGRLFAVLDDCSRRTNLGAAELGVGLILGEMDCVIPDLVWLSQERYSALLDERGHLQGAPELVIEVVSPGKENERCDRQVKLKLYSAYGVQEYWIVDWQRQEVAIWQRQMGVLQLHKTLYRDDVLESHLLPGFSCPLPQIWA